MQSLNLNKSKTCGTTTKPKWRYLPIIHSTVGNNPPCCGTVKHGEGWVMIWACFTTLYSSEYQSIPESTVRTSVQQPSVGTSWGMQHDEESKHSSRSATGSLKRKNIKVLRWLHLNPTQCCH